MSRLNDIFLKYFLNKWVARKQFETGRDIQLTKSFYVTISPIKPTPKESKRENK